MLAPGRNTRLLSWEVSVHPPGWVFPTPGWLLGGGVDAAWTSAWTLGRFQPEDSGPGLIPSEEVALVSGSA